MIQKHALILQKFFVAYGNQLRQHTIKPFFFFRDTTNTTLDAETQLIHIAIIEHRASATL